MFMKRALAIVGFVVLVTSHSWAAPTSRIDLSVSRARVQRGESVEFRIRNAGDEIKAVLFVPTEGVKPLPLNRSPESNEFQVKYTLPNDAPEGLYVVHPWIGDESNPTAIGKATFLLGRLVNDFFIAS